MMPEVFATKTDMWIWCAWTDVRVCKDCAVYRWGPFAKRRAIRAVRARHESWLHQFHLANVALAEARLRCVQATHECFHEIASISERATVLASSRAPS